MEWRCEFSSLGSIGCEPQVFFIKKNLSIDISKYLKREIKVFFKDLDENCFLAMNLDCRLGNFPSLDKEIFLKGQNILKVEFEKVSELSQFTSIRNEAHINNMEIVSFTNLWKNSRFLMFQSMNPI